MPFCGHYFRHSDHVPSRSQTLTFFVFQINSFQLNPQIQTFQATTKLDNADELLNDRIILRDIRQQRCVSDFDWRVAFPLRQVDKLD